MYLSCLLVTSVLQEISRPLGMGLTTSMIGSDGPERKRFHRGFIHYLLVIVDSSLNLLVLLTGSNEDSPSKRLHLVADRSHCHRVVSSRLQLRMDVIMIVIR